MEHVLTSTNAPVGMVDYAGDTREVPKSWEPAVPSEADLAAIKKLMFTRKLIDPTNEQEFEANEIRDIFRFGRTSNNLQVSVPKTKKVGEYEFKGDLMMPIISPSSFFCGSDYQEWRPSLNFFILTPANKDDKPPRLPKYLKKWHPEDHKILKEKLGNAHMYLSHRVPGKIIEDFNIFKHNRHPLLAQGAHRCAALFWQIMQQFEHSDGFKQNELDAWSYIAYLELAYSGEDWGFELDEELLKFIANRIETTVNVDEFGSKGYQDFTLRRVFLCFYLGFHEEGWDAACGISKLRGTEFTKSLLYDYVLELKEEPQKFRDLFREDPKELLSYFKM